MRYVFLQFPILGEGSVKAAIATECAANQGKFWEYHDALFEASGKQGRGVFVKDGLVGVADDMHLDTGKFTECLTDGSTVDGLKTDSGDAVALGVRGTPTIFINDVLYQGPRSFEAMSDRIEEALSGK